MWSKRMTPAIQHSIFVSRKLMRSFYWSQVNSRRRKMFNFPGIVFNLTRRYLCRWNRIFHCILIVLLIYGSIPFGKARSTAVEGGAACTLCIPPGLASLCQTCLESTQHWLAHRLSSANRCLAQVRVQHVSHESGMRSASQIGFINAYLHPFILYLWTLQRSLCYSFYNSKFCIWLKMLKKTLTIYVS